MASGSLGVCQPPKPRTLPAFPVLNLPSVRSPFPAGSLETPEIRSVTEVTRHARQRARAGGAGGGACGGRGGAGSRLTGAALGAAVGRRRSRGPGSEGRGAPRRRVPHSERGGGGGGVRPRALTPGRSVPPRRRAGAEGQAARAPRSASLSAPAEFSAARRDSGSREDAMPARPLPLRSRPSPELWSRPGGSHSDPAVGLGEGWCGRLWRGVLKYFCRAVVAKVMGCL